MKHVTETHRNLPKYRLFSFRSACNRPFFKRATVLIASLLVFLSGACQAEKESDPSLLTLVKIFSQKEFSLERFGPARWLKDSSGYTTLEPSVKHDKARDIVLYNPDTGRREIMVSSHRLIPQDLQKPLSIENHEWSSDGKRLLVFTNSKRVWRQNTRGDYWVLDLRDWELDKLGGDARPSTLMFAKFSPDGNRVAYVRENNLYVEDLANRRIKQMTSDGSQTIINGTFDWVYEEEFGLRDGFRWSPDGKSLAYWQLDTEGVGVFNLINNTDSLYPSLTPIPYPKAGTTNSASRVGVAGVEGGQTRWIDLPGDSHNHYIAQMDWAESSEEIVFQRLNRLQNANTLMLADVRSGRTKALLTEKDSAWLDVVNDLTWLNNGESFTWVSERSGWRHVYIGSRSGGSIRPVTRGKFDVISVVRIDEKGGWLYYMASPHNPTQSYLYRTRLDGSGRPERLTPENMPGMHRYQVSPDAKWAFHTFSSFDEPPVTSIVSLPGHKEVRRLVDNAEVREKVHALKRLPTEFFRVDIGKGVLLDAWCMKPPDFDPKKKYPLIFYVYGEPAGQTVVDRWGGNRYLWHLMLAQKGYLVMSVDNRGTPAPRGREWRKIIYRQVGILASTEQAAAAQAIMKNRTYVDPERIGIWGWSGGGSMSLNAIFRYPDLYRMAMAVAPVSNQRFYDTIYQERYMGLPEENEEGYKNGSPITFAHQLKGNLMLVHGTGDDNVHYQSAEALVNALIAANKKFAFMSYPNRSHGIFEGKNTTLHLYGLLTDYLEKNLTPGPLNNK